ncbi:MAG TPA: hypothetical protein VNT75_01645 [Symbiobacteriaceae bacterium]|nr:hypothetical protein [Symbiobacteriaceae bacterium]
MRTYRILPALPAAALLVLTAVTPAYAGGGLPVLTALKAGPAEITVYGDSLFLHPGSNTLTLEATGVAEDAKITLQLTGPSGQVVNVPIGPLQYIQGPDGGHGGGDDHGSGGGDEHGDEHSAAAAEDVVWFRGKAALPADGRWKAQLTVNGATATDELNVVKNGPSPYYLAVTGLAMGGTALYSVTQRLKRKEER